MSTISAISTGEQTVTTTGAVTGSLDTSALTGAFTVKLRVRSLTSAQNLQIVLEDTANASAFSDATQPWSVTVAGVNVVEGSTYSVESYQIPACRFGATNTKLRVNVQVATGSPSAKLIAWLEQ
jgi:hypothetical protein